MPTLVFVRHGITDWNVDGRFQGQLDIPLNAAGRRQAEVVRAHLEPIAFDRVYASPLKRAEETARILAGHQRVVADWRLAEIHHGDWQGKTKEEIESQWPDEWAVWNKDPLKTKTSGGESPNDLRRRVQDFLMALTGNSVLCVSHGVVIQTVREILLGTAFEDRASPPRNASVHTFTFGPDNVARYKVEQVV
jgi:broad specificity phosphatase PhoE